MDTWICDCEEKKDCELKDSIDDLNCTGTWYKTRNLWKINFLLEEFVFFGEKLLFRVTRHLVGKEVTLVSWDFFHMLTRNRYVLSRAINEPNAYWKGTQKHGNVKQIKKLVHNLQ